VTPALVATLGRLDAATEYGEVRAGAPPAGAGWVPARAALDDPTVVAGWFAALRAGEAHPPDVAASFLAGWLADILLHAPSTALATERRTWALDPAQLWLHASAEGWFDGLAVGDATLRVLPDDPAGGDAGVEVVADAAAMRRLLAAEAVAVLDPLFTAVRALAPFGRRGMWGSLADGLAGGAVWTAFTAGADTAAAFDAAMALVDDIAAAGGGPLNRPRAVPIECRHGTVTVTVRGSCCLWYKTAGAATEAEEDARYCTSCPLRDPATQVERFTTWLDEQPTPGTTAA
jgi:hypothetical protein